MANLGNLDDNIFENLTDTNVPESTRKLPLNIYFNKAFLISHYE